MNKFTSLLLIITHAHVAESALRGNSSPPKRNLLVAHTIRGECTVASFADGVGSVDTLAYYLAKSSSDTAGMQEILDIKCADALRPQKDLSDTLEKGPQFLKNFLDGGSTWNNNYEDSNGSYVLSDDAAIIKTVHDNDAKTTVFAAPDGGTSAHYPRYFSNFYKGDQECRLGVIECCYTASREASRPFSGNADMCALDMKGAAESNHIKNRSKTYYDTNDTSAPQAYCSAFAYEADSFGDSVKYNTLFHMAMKTNLYDNGLVKNIPGAPLCGCVEQMPIVDYADCVEAIEGYKIDSSGNVVVDISWQECETDLASYYDTLNRSDMEKYFVNSKIVGQGQCAVAATSFMNDQMLVPV
jgi:hypothetical protein